MPNWCEGFLKIRGDRQNIKNFLLNGLIAYEWGIRTNFEEIPIKNSVELRCEYDDEIIIDINYEAHITGTKRAFAMKDTVCIESYDNRLPITTIKIKQAWNMKADDFLPLAKQYKVDFRLFGYEKGQEFTRDIIIENGIVKKDLTEGYENWNWECPLSELGG